MNSSACRCSYRLSTHTCKQMCITRPPLSHRWSHALCHCSSVFHLSTMDLWQTFHFCCVLCLVTQLCPTLCDPMDRSPPGSSVHGDCPGQNTGVGCHALPQGIFPTQELSPGLLHHRQILYHLSHQGGPKKC